MQEFFKNLLLSFIPVFVAVDAVGILPIFVSMTEGLSGRYRNKVIIQSLITALCLSIGFIFLGKIIFKLLGVSVGDFMVAGGVILFCLAIMDIILSDKEKRIPGEHLGVVPLGTPLIAGPALLTTSLVIIEEYGLIPTLVSVTLNILIVGVVFFLAGFLTRVLGDAGSKALSKITSLFLATIAVMMVRKGMMYLFQNF